MVMWFPYQLCCSTFHSDKAVPTFCFAADDRLKVLRVVNQLLDLFLTEKLPRRLESEGAPEREEADHA